MGGMFGMPASAVPGLQRPALSGMRPRDGMCAVNCPKRGGCVHGMRMDDGACGSHS